LTVTITVTEKISNLNHTGCIESKVHQIKSNQFGSFPNCPTLILILTYCAINIERFPWRPLWPPADLSESAKWPLQVLYIYISLKLHIDLVAM